jgi:glycosyltransferase involved in cell wall biosynthesis
VTGALRIGVPGHLLELEGYGGHAKVWRRVIERIAEDAEVTGLSTHRWLHGRRRTLDVVLCSGHEELPAADVPVVAQIHEAGWFTPELRALLDPGFLREIEAPTERAVRTAARLLVPSRTVATDIATAYGIAAERVHAVPHGADPVFRTGIDGSDAVIVRHGGTAETPYVLYAASLHPRKNLAVLREAFASLVVAEKLPHELVIAGGDAPDRADSSALRRGAVNELAGVPGRIVRVVEPDDDELAALMAGAAAYCLPSLYEGFGLTALEAMACGAPVLVSDRGALPEVVGDAGLVVEPTADRVREGLARLLGDAALAERLAGAGPARARRFTWEATAAGWLSVLRDAVRR